MACPHCGSGNVGPHSDYCLDCGEDTIKINKDVWRVVKGIIIALIWIGYFIGCLTGAFKLGLGFLVLVGLTIIIYKDKGI